MSPSTLPRPTGFARFEPGPEWVGVAALTGLAAPPEVTSRAALAVKIDNAPGGPPQWNLADADLVFEENVEGVTRFVAVYPVEHARPDRTGALGAHERSRHPRLPQPADPRLVGRKSPGHAGGPRCAHVRMVLEPLGAIVRLLLAQCDEGIAPQPDARSRHAPRDSATLAGPARPVFSTTPAATSRASARALHGRMDGLDVTWVWDAESQRYLRAAARRLAHRCRRRRGRCRERRRAVRRLPQSDADPRSPEAVTVGSVAGPAASRRCAR